MHAIVHVVIVPSTGTIEPMQRQHFDKQQRDTKNKLKKYDGILIKLLNQTMQLHQAIYRSHTNSVQVKIKSWI